MLIPWKFTYFLILETAAKTGAGVSKKRHKKSETSLKKGNEYS